MRKLVHTLGAVLLVCLLATTAHAEPRGARFVFGMKDNHELSAFIAAGLTTDSSGTSLLSPKKCATPGDRSCASARDFLTEILRINPRASMDGVPLQRVEQLPRYIAKLRMDKRPPGDYYMACEVRTTDLVNHPSGWKPKSDCVVRHFRTWEKVYIDPDTGVMVFAQECNNPVGERFRSPKPCVEIWYRGDVSLRDSQIHFKEFGLTDLANDKDCPAMLLLAGETDWEAAFIERCTISGVACSFNGADRAVAGTGARGWQTGSHPIAATGWNRLRVSRKFAEEASKARIFFCMFRGNDTQSCGIGVQWFDYLPNKKTGTLVATIQYTEKDSLKARQVSRVGKPVQLWWEFDKSFCP